MTTPLAEGLEDCYVEVDRGESGSESDEESSSESGHATKPALKDALAQRSVSFALSDDPSEAAASAVMMAVLILTRLHPLRLRRPGCVTMQLLAATRQPGMRWRALATQDSNM